MKMFIVKGNKEKEINAEKVIELILRYNIAGTTYNNHGQVIYIYSRKGSRTHSILISNK